ncbi:MAG: GC-type dockerin domain-anchored protein [Phycisphaerales bacterium]
MSVRRMVVQSVVLLPASAGLALPLQAQCVPEWSAVQVRPFGSGMNVRAAVEWDDGTGPALYLGGDFSILSGTFTTGVTKWDGTKFTSMNCGFFQGNGGQFGTVSGLTSWDPDGDGPQPSVLVACGDFVFTNGNAFTSVSNVAMWDGTSWSPIGGGYEFANPNPQGGGGSGRVTDVKVFDDGSGPKLYACGDFILSDAHRNLARWNGSAWEGVGPTYSLQGSFERMLAHDDGGGSKLYFTGVNINLFPASVPATYMVRWSGTAFETVGAGPGNPATVGNPRYLGDMATFDPDGAGPQAPLLCVAGRYGSLGNSQLDLFTWNGSAWTQRTVPSSEPGEATNNYRGLTTLTVFNDGSGPALYMGPQQVNDGAHPASAHFYRAKKWNGTTFSNVAASSRPNTPQNESTVPACMAPFTLGGGSKLCIGYYAQGEGILQQFNGSQWNSMPEQSGPEGKLRVIDSVMWDSDGAGPNPALLYCVGEFPWGNAATYDGQSFAPLPALPASTLPLASIDDVHLSCAVFNDGSGEAFYVGATKGATIDDVPASLGSGVYKLSGSTWTPVGVEKSFHALNPNTGTTNDDSIVALRAFNDGSGSKLYATGRFETINGVTVNNVARWNGAAWEPVGSSGPLAGATSVMADASLGVYIPRGSQLLTFDDGTGTALYLAGQFTRVGGVRAAGIARWNGAAWSAYGTDFSEPVRLSGQLAVAVHDDGSGAKMFASGMAIGGSLNTYEPHVHRHDGAGWSEITSGFAPTLGPVWLMGSLDNGSGRKLLLSGADIENGVCDIYEFTGSSWAEVPDSMCYGDGWGRVQAFEFATLRHGVLCNTGPGMNGTLRGCQYFGVDMRPSLTMSVWGCGSATPVTCPADLGRQGGVTGADGSLDNNDFIAFISFFFNADPHADMGRQGGLPGRDGQFDNNDFIAFINAFFAGCP